MRICDGKSKFRESNTQLWTAFHMDVAHEMIILFVGWKLELMYMNLSPIEWSLGAPIHYAMLYKSSPLDKPWYILEYREMIKFSRSICADIQTI